VLLALTRRWLAALTALYPPGFRRAVGTDLARLLGDAAADAAARGEGALVTFVMWNTVICLRDALLEWSAAAGREWTTMKGGKMNVQMRTQTLKQVVRGLVRRPGYSVPALLTLALGIGANTAMFTVFNGVVLRPLPYAQPERVVEVFGAEAGDGSQFASFSLPDLRDWGLRSQTLEHLAGYSTLPSDLILTGGSDALEVETAYVSAGFFEALGVQPLLGRTLRPEEELGDNRLVVASHAFWQEHLGADPAAVGQTLPMSGDDYRLVGVMPESFDFPTPRVQVWTFLSVIPSSSIPMEYRPVRFLQAVGRLAEGVTASRARDELSSIAGALALEYPDSNDELVGATVRPLYDGVVGTVGRTLAVLMAAAALILVIVCANLANLAMAREARREPELALRAALGASRRQRAGLVMTESLVLSLVGGGLGLLLAWWGTDLLVARSGGTLPRAHEISPDWTVALFSLGVSVLTGVLFAALPGLSAGRRDLAGRLRAAKPAGATPGGARRALVVTQMALSVVLLVGGVLLTRSLWLLGQVDPGFDPETLLVAEITFPSSRYPERAEYLQRYEETLDGLARIPGVTSVGTLRKFPFRYEGEGVRWTVPGQVEGAEALQGRLFQASPGVFQTMGIDFIEGRGFEADAGRDGRGVAVVSRSVARASFGPGSAVGRTILFGDDPIEIVGVVEDVRLRDLTGEPPAIIYLPQYLSPRRGAAFVLRTSSDPEALMAAVRGVVRSQDPSQPITELVAASRIMAEQTLRPRFFVLLLAGFAGLALVLCAVGVYGVVAFGVAGRRREVGIRLAVGADQAGVRRLVVRQGMTPVLAGIVLGVGGALALARVLEALVYGVGVYDPLAYALAAGTLALVGLAACWVPARDAARTPPVEALLGE
jgi:predicted permease